MRLLGLSILAVVAVVLQGTLLYAAGPGGVTVDLALILTLFTAWRWGYGAGTTLGLWSGALVGAATATSVPMALLYGLSGWTAAALARQHPSRHPLRAAALGGLVAVSIRGLESLVLRLTQAEVPVAPESVAWTLVLHGAGLAFLAAVADRPIRLQMPRIRPGLFRRGRKSSWNADWATMASAG